MITDSIAWPSISIDKRQKENNTDSRRWNMRIVNELARTTRCTYTLLPWRYKMVFEKKPLLNCKCVCVCVCIMEGRYVYIDCICQKLGYHRYHIVHSSLTVGTPINRKYPWCDCRGTEGWQIITSLRSIVFFSLHVRCKKKKYHEDL